jgi:hypothetical protein
MDVATAGATRPPPSRRTATMATRARRRHGLVWTAPRTRAAGATPVTRWPPPVWSRSRRSLELHSVQHHPADRPGMDTFLPLQATEALWPLRGHPDHIRPPTSPQTCLPLASGQCQTREYAWPRARPPCFVAAPRVVAGGHERSHGQAPKPEAVATVATGRERAASSRRYWRRPPESRTAGSVAGTRPA